MSESDEPLGDRAGATLFAYCPRCRVLWLGLGGDTLRHKCAPIDPGSFNFAEMWEETRGDALAARREAFEPMMVDIPTQYAERVHTWKP